MKSIKMLQPLEERQVDDAGLLLASIHRTAARMFNENWQTGQVEAWCLMVSGVLKGVLAFIYQQDFVVCYAVIQPDVLVQALVCEIDQHLDESLARRQNRPFFFNLRGDMSLLIAHLRQSGFKEDTSGYELVCDRFCDLMEPHAPALKGLEMRRFEPEHFTGYLHMLDRAFNPLIDLDAGKPDSFWRDRDELEKKFIELSENGNFAAFWQGKELIGLYYFSDDLIEVLAVDPDFQSRGYGRILLQHATETLLNERGIPSVYLFVIVSNERARRFYLKWGFRITGFYSENTYVGDVSREKEKNI